MLYLGHCFAFLYQVYQAQLREGLLYCSASLAMSTGVIKAFSGKIDIKIHSPSIFIYSVHESHLAAKMLLL